MTTGPARSRLALLLAVAFFLGCGGRRHTAGGGVASGLSAVTPAPGLFLRSAFDSDPSRYLGRFVADGVGRVDESMAFATACSQYVQWTRVGAGGVVYDEYMAASDAAALSLGIPPVAVGASGEVTDLVRVRYTLTSKLVADIEDPAAFEACCKSAPDQCTGRYIGEFLEGTVQVYRPLSSMATAQATGGHIDVKAGVPWQKAVEATQPVYFAFRTHEAGFAAEANFTGCGDWTTSPPRSARGQYFVGVSDTMHGERQAREAALEDARRQAAQWLAEPGGIPGTQHATAAVTVPGTIDRWLVDEQWCLDEQLTAAGSKVRARVLVFLPSGAGPGPVSRFPYLGGPSTLRVGQVVPVPFQLTVEPRAQLVEASRATAPESIAQGAVTVDDGQASPGTGMALPVSEDQERDGWDITVVLDTPGFATLTEPVATVHLPPSGDSTPAMFQLRLERAPSDGPARVSAYLYEGDSYLGRVSRYYQVEGAAHAAPPVARSGGGVVVGASAAVDLDVKIVRSGHAENGKAFVIVGRRGRIPTVHQVDYDWQALDGELAAAYTRFSAESRRSARLGRQGEGCGPNGTGCGLPALRAFGHRLWSNFVPAPVQRAISETLADAGTRPVTIQVYSDDPDFPWELLHPEPAAGLDPGQPGFLSLRARLARWHLDDHSPPRPPGELAWRELAVVAPSYAGQARLPAVEEELAVLAEVPGFRQVGARRPDLEGLLGQLQPGVLHFAGHGDVDPDQPGPTSHRIRLEDQPFDQLDWSAFAQAGASQTFVFFNACEVGQTTKVASFVDGWAPTVLNAGAAGYLGGLWSLSDEGAAAFSAHFYRELERRLEADGEADVGEVLATVRREVLQHGDITFMAYALYGDVGLRFRREE